MNTEGIVTGTHTWWATAFGIAASAAVYVGITLLGRRR
jgi:hypothetical protein